MKAEGFTGHEELNSEAKEKKKETQFLRLQNWHDYWKC